MFEIEIFIVFKNDKMYVTFLSDKTTLKINFWPYYQNSILVRKRYRGYKCLLNAISYTRISDQISISKKFLGD